MKKLLVSACWWGAVLFLALCLTGMIWQPQLEGSGVADSEMRAVPDFTSVQVSGGIQLDLIVGPATALEVSADDNILPHVVTEVCGGRLSVFVDSSFSSSVGIKVRAMTPQVKAVEASGASTATLTGINGKQFRLALSGASTCALTGNADRMDLRLSGASTCTMTGNGDNVHLKLSGASNCTLNGNAEHLAVECSGASRLLAAGLTAQTVKTSVSGASRVEVMALKDLNARASGASTVRYAGTPAALYQRASGASTIAPKS